MHSRQKGVMLIAIYDPSKDGRIGKDALEITLNKLLKGAGIGSDPTEIDVPSGVSFTDLIGNENYGAGSAAWTDWDLSGIVPAGTVTVLVAVKNVKAGTNLCGVRKNGSASARYFNVDGSSPLAQSEQGYMVTECDASRIIETYAQYANDGDFAIKGYWN